MHTTGRLRRLVIWLASRSDLVDRARGTKPRTERREALRGVRSSLHQMSWADNHIARLATGETIQFRPHGNSMTGRIADGQLCTVAPVTSSMKLHTDDVVLCRVNGRQYLHLIKAIQGAGTAHERFQIGNNRGDVNGWASRRQIFGRLIAVG